MNHIGATMSLSATLLKWLEAYVATGAYANSDAANRPSLLQVLGDTNVGMKAFGEARQGVLRSAAAPSSDPRERHRRGRPRRIGTARSFALLAHQPICAAWTATFPLRFSINATYSLDNTGDVLAATEAASQGILPSRASSASASGSTASTTSTSTSAPKCSCSNERIRPFLEYGILIPINRQGYQCRPEQPERRPCLANDKVAPSKLTLGSRFYPWKHGFSLLARGGHRRHGRRKLHRRGRANAAVDALHRRRLGNRHAGSPAGREGEDRREGVEARGAHQGSRAREGQGHRRRERHRRVSTGTRRSRRSRRRRRPLHDAASCPSALTSSSFTRTDTRTARARRRWRRSRRTSSSTARSRRCRGSGNVVGHVTRRRDAGSGLGRRASSSRTRPARSYAPRPTAQARSSSRRHPGHRLDRGRRRRGTSRSCSQRSVQAAPGQQRRPLGLKKPEERARRGHGQRDPHQAAESSSRSTRP